MTEQEFKQSIEQMQNEVKSANDKAADLATKLSERENEISNLDATAKEQQKSIDELRKSMKATQTNDFKTAFRMALEAKKEEIETLVKSKKDNFDMVLEVKTDVSTSSVSPNNFLSVVVDPALYGAPAMPQAFIAVLGLRPRTGNKLGWIEASTTPVVDYVDELATNSNQSSCSFVEKSRQFGKVATYMTISTEISDWFQQIYDYCVNEGIRIIANKIDNDILLGVGSDADAPKKIYGLKYNATAFSALAASKVVDANEADVIIDAAAQIAKEGFNANVAFVTFAEEAAIKAAKDANGNYLYDKVRAALGNIRVVPSDRVPAGEMLILDTTCAQVYAGNGFELEFERVPSIDGYKVWFRKAAQVKVPTSHKKGIIHVSSVTTAIAALTKSGNAAGIAGIKTGTDKLAAAVNSDNQVETHPNS